MKGWTTSSMWYVKDFIKEIQREEEDVPTLSFIFYI